MGSLLYTEAHTLCSLSVRIVRPVHPVSIVYIELSAIVAMGLLTRERASPAVVFRSRYTLTHEEISHVTR